MGDVSSPIIYGQGLGVATDRPNLLAASLHPKPPTRIDDQLFTSMPNGYNPQTGTVQLKPPFTVANLTTPGIGDNYFSLRPPAGFESVPRELWGQFNNAATTNVDITYPVTDEFGNTTMHHYQGEAKVVVINGYQVIAIPGQNGAPPTYIRLIADNNGNYTGQIVNITQNPGYSRYGPEPKYILTDATPGRVTADDFNFTITGSNGTSATVTVTDKPVMAPNVWRQPVGLA